MTVVAKYCGADDDPNPPPLRIREMALYDTQTGRRLNVTNVAIVGADADPPLARYLERAVDGNTSLAGGTTRIPAASYGEGGSYYSYDNDQPSNFDAYFGRHPDEWPDETNFWEDDTCRRPGANVTVELSFGEPIPTYPAFELWMPRQLKHAPRRIRVTCEESYYNFAQPFELFGLVRCERACNDCGCTAEYDDAMTITDDCPAPQPSSDDGREHFGCDPPWRGNSDTSTWQDPTAENIGLAEADYRLLGNFRDSIKVGRYEYVAPSPPQPKPGFPPLSPGEGAFCSDTCNFASDGECNDGGPGSTFVDCDFGTDCARPLSPPNPPLYRLPPRTCILLMFLLRQSARALYLALPPRTRGPSMRRARMHAPTCLLARVLLQVRTAASGSSLHRRRPRRPPPHRHHWSRRLLPALQTRRLRRRPRRARPMHAHRVRASTSCGSTRGEQRTALPSEAGTTHGPMPNKACGTRALKLLAISWRGTSMAASCRTRPSANSYAETPGIPGLLITATMVVKEPADSPGRSVRPACTSLPIPFARRAQVPEDRPTTGDATGTRCASPTASTRLISTTVAESVSAKQG